MMSQRCSGRRRQTAISGIARQQAAESRGRPIAAEIYADLSIVEGDQLDGAKK